MDFVATEIPDIVKIVPKRHGDDRGYFSEIFRMDRFRDNIGEIAFVQDNFSLSRDVGTVRGLHFQVGDAAQGKLVRCIRGEIFDVAVDIRAGSPTYGRHVAMTLSPEEGAWLWIPAGFAHGFCTTKPDSEVLYKVTAYYSAKDDRGVRWNDPDFGISWPVDEDQAILSGKDKVQPFLADMPPAFQY